MPAPRPWTIHRPGPLVVIDDNMWCVEDDVPGIPKVNRRMVIVRRDGGELLFFNAIPVPDETLAAIRALGRPAQLVVPNAYHALDAGPFVQKLDVKAYAPVVAIEPLRVRLPLRSVADLPRDGTVSLETVDGFRTSETVLLVKSGPRVSIVAADLFTNVRHAGGPAGLLMRLVGFTGPAPRLPMPVRRRVGRDLPAVRALLERLAAAPGLHRLVPSHGAITTEAPAEALRAIARSF